MNRKQVLALALIGALLAAFCSWFIATRDRDCVLSYNVQTEEASVDDYVVEVDEEGIIEIKDVQADGRFLNVSVSPREPGISSCSSRRKTGGLPKGAPTRTTSSSSAARS